MKLGCGTPYDRAFLAGREDPLRCLRDFRDRSTAQRPGIGIDPNRRRFGLCKYPGNVGRIDETCGWVEISSVEQRPFFPNSGEGLGDMVLRVGVFFRGKL